MTLSLDIATGNCVFSEFKKTCKVAYRPSLDKTGGPGERINDRDDWGHFNPNRQVVGYHCFNLVTSCIVKYGKKTIAF